MSAIVPEASAQANVISRSEPTEGLAAPQQGATAPGSGHEVSASSDPEQPSEKLPFKQQVGAWAHIHHANITRKPEEKEHFQKVLAGEIPPPVKSDAT